MKYNIVDIVEAGLPKLKDPYKYNVTSICGKIDVSIYKETDDSADPWGNDIRIKVINYQDPWTPYINFEIPDKYLQEEE